MKRFLRALSRRFGVRIHSVSNDPGLIDYINGRGISIVIDVGANIGQFGETLRANGYLGRIISFEPVESAFQMLSKKAAEDGNWQAHHCGLGASSGEAAINVSEFTVFSSILTVTGAATQFDERAAVKRTETIRLRTLDEVAAGLSDKILLKVDTQGYERQVIEGGRETISRLQGILLELPIIHYYEGTWKFHEAVRFMEQAGFIPAQFHPAGIDSKDRVSLSEVDCLFRPLNGSR